MDIQRKDVHNSELPVLCQACESRHRGVCGALTADQLLQLSKHSTRRTLEPGAELAGESVQTKTYSNIISGVVKLSKMMADGRQQIVGLQFAPDFLGRPFRKENGVSAEAATDVKVCSFPKHVIERMIGEMPELEHKLLEQTLDELDEARNWMLTLGRKTAGEKVASFLLLIATHAYPDNDSDSVEFELPMSRMDIADFLGLTMETVSRQLTKLRADGVIRIVNNRHVEVPDIPRLSDRSGM
ncbi:Crp/Fnr family transcriptional regulator [Hoeflea sp.]|uniref:Crp/Fnr family transcriptional regulator n=1 Tax=Hoeflea sp. TaxID=1940281 RepID=UPI0019B41802|nr:Crp/Fnr family transcriptional regulator [Hoeflea sp.]MBC7281978.1 Crp/Fnr family transcriptional regulator [Hoeflea sp.]